MPFSVLYTAMILEASSSIVSLFYTANRIYFVSIIGEIWQVKMQIWRKIEDFGDWNLLMSEKSSTFAASFVYVYATYTDEWTLK